MAAAAGPVLCAPAATAASRLWRANVEAMCAAELAEADWRVPVHAHERHGQSGSSSAGEGGGQPHRRGPVLQACRTFCRPQLPISASHPLAHLEAHRLRLRWTWRPPRMLRCRCTGRIYTKVHLAIPIQTCCRCEVLLTRPLPSPPFCPSSPFSPSPILRCGPAQARVDNYRASRKQKKNLDSFWSPDHSPATPLLAPESYLATAPMRSTF